MGCVSSNLLNPEKEEFSCIGHHIVSLTSTTYGLLNLDPLTTPAPCSVINPLPRSDPPEVINSWELMAGLVDENSHPNIIPLNSNSSSFSLDGFEKLCPPGGESKVVIYTTTLRGVRKTFEACNAVRAAFQAFGVSFSERDISMDRGFRDELRLLMMGKHDDSLPPTPRVFVKGRYLGGVHQLLRIVEDGSFADLVRGLPKLNCVCRACGGIRFLPCSSCNGSCKLLVNNNNNMKKKNMMIKEPFPLPTNNALNPKVLNHATNYGCYNNHTINNNNVVVVKCSVCNENGLVVCPICT